MWFWQFPQVSDFFPNKKQLTANLLDSGKQSGPDAAFLFFTGNLGVEKTDLAPMLFKKRIGHHCPGTSGAMKKDFLVDRDFREARLKFIQGNMERIFQLSLGGFLVGPDINNNNFGRFVRNDLFEFLN